MNKKKTRKKKQFMAFLSALVILGYNLSPLSAITTYAQVASATYNISGNSSYIYVDIEKYTTLRINNYSGTQMSYDGGESGDDDDYPASFTSFQLYIGENCIFSDGCENWGSVSGGGQVFDISNYTNGFYANGTSMGNRMIAIKGGDSVTFNITFSNNDVTAPTFTATADNSSYTATKDITIAGGDSQSHYAYVSIQKDDEEELIWDKKKMDIKSKVFSTTYNATDNGTYTITATDTNGNTATQSVTINTIDNVAPRLVNEADIDLSSKWGQEKSFNFQFEETGTNEVYVALDDGDYEGIVKNPKTGYYEIEYTFDTEVNTNVSHTIKYKDAGGNEATTSFYVGKIDKTAPTVTEFVSDATEGTAKTVTLTATATDSTSGIGGYRFHSTAEVNANNSFLDNWITSNTLIAKENGTYYVDVKDGAGNITEYLTPIEVTNVDNSAPLLTNEADIDLYTTWSSAKSATFIFSEADSDEVFVALDDGLFANATKNEETGNFEITYEFTEELNGRQQHIVYFKDNLDNADSKTFYVDKIDKTNPIVNSLTVNPTEGVKRYVSLTADATDSMSGVAYYRFYSTSDEINNNNAYLNVWLDTNSVNVSANGTYYAEVRDVAGLIATSQAVQVTNVDSKAPTLEITVGNSSDGVYKVVTASVVESTLNNTSISGLKVDENNHINCITIMNEAGESIPFTYSDSNTDGTTYSSTKAQFKTKDSDTFYIRVLDNVGNYSIKNIYLDVSAPELDYINGIDGENLDGKNTYPEWTNGSVKLTSYIYNPQSTYDWSWDYTGTMEEFDALNGTWTRGKVGTLNEKNASYNSYSVSENGTYTVYAVDSTSGIFKKTLDVTNIDTVKPVITAIVDGDYLNIEANDTESGIDYLLIAGGSLDTVTQKDFGGAFTAQTLAKISTNGTYTITAFDKAGNSTTINQTVAVTPSATVDEIFTVNFCNYNGAIIKSQAVTKGDDATPPSNPTRTGYTFTGWDSSYTNITADKTVKAMYEQNETTETTERTKYYTVNFCNYDGSVLKSQAVAEYGSATPPNSPTKTGYTFVGWSGSYANVTNDTVVTAKFIEGDSSLTSSNGLTSSLTYNVTFLNFDGAILKSQAVATGGSATPPSNPTRTGYRFTGWSGSYTNIVADTSVTAKFIEDATATTGTTTSSTGTSTSGSGSSGTSTYRGTTTTAGTTNSVVGSEFDETTDTTEEPIVADETITDGTMLLTEYSAEALPLAVADDGTNGKGYTVTTDLETGEDIPTTTESLTNQDSSTNSTKKVMALGFLVLSAGAVGFYFLNKKYFWIDLPF